LEAALIFRNGARFVKSIEVTKPMTEQEREVAEIMADAKRVEAAVQEAVREALIFHKSIGNSIAEWRDGRIVLIPAEEIEIPQVPTKV
jgi:hypothetical protein